MYILKAFCPIVIIHGRLYRDLDYLIKIVQIALTRAAIVKVMTGVGSSTLDICGARAVLNIDAKFRKPNEVAWKSVGKTEALDTYSMTYALEVPN